MSFLRFFRLLLFGLLWAGVVAPARAQLNPQEQQIASLMTNASGQNRPSVTVDPILSRVARARAMDMAKRRYFSHTNPDGRGPNALVRAAGFALPSSYSQAANGNNIESIAAGDPTASGTWGLWMGSAGHKRHLLAQESFYTEQTLIGVGYFHDDNSPYIDYWVVLSAPPPGPTLAIATPIANAGLTAEAVTVTGTSAGTPAAARVVVRVENAGGVGAFVNATGTSSWSVTVPGLTADSNLLRVRTLDGGGATIKEVTRTVRRIVLKPLVISTVGTGTVTKTFGGTSQRELGATYRIGATPGAGWLFDRWSGSVESTSATISFVMVEGFNLTAHFRVNPFDALRNTYSGLVQAEAATHDSSGFLKITTTANATFSGKFTLAGKAYSLIGRFDESGEAQVVIRRGSLAPLTVTLHLDLTEGTKLVTGSVTDGVFTAEFTANPAAAPAARHAATGRYTVALQPDAEDTGAAFPQGTGAAALVVGASGNASLTGTLANGTNFSFSGSMTASGALAIYLPLWNGRGSLVGTLVADAETGGISGGVLWTKPATPTAAAFREAFVTELTLAGARYVAPAAGNASLRVRAPINNSSLMLSGGGLRGQLEQVTTIFPTNRVSVAAPPLADLSLKIAAASGRVSGQFTHPVSGARSRIFGVILQDRNVATGFFLSRDQSGRASLFAAP